MKKVILLTGLVLITLSSCKNKELEELRLENQQLRNEKHQQSQTVYVWTTIQCKVGSYTVDNGYGKEGFFNGTTNTLYWSDIVQKTAIVYHLQRIKVSIAQRLKVNHLQRVKVNH